MKINPKRAKEFLGSGYKKFKAVLLCGNNTGLIREYCNELSKQFDNVVKTACVDVVKSFSRLNNEINTIPLLGSNKIIIIDDVTNALFKPLQALIAGPAVSEEIFIVLCGEQILSKDSLRKFFEVQTYLAVLPCYSFETLDVKSIVHVACKEGRLTLKDSEALDYVAANLSGDANFVRNEVDKLIQVFANDRVPLSKSDIQSILSANLDTELDRYVFYMFEKKFAQAELELTKLEETGIKTPMLIRCVLRYYMQLHLVHAHIASGASLEAAIARIQPPIFFRHVPAFTAAFKTFSSDQILNKIEKLVQLEITMKTRDFQMPWTICGKYLFDILGV